MDAETFRRLLTEPGQALLAEIAQRAGVESDHALGARLRTVHDGDFVAAAVTQNHLRGLAAAKFGDDAARMYFTHDALEQATRASVATHRAQTLRSLGVRKVVDLGCGIGSDLIAAARAGIAVRGVDIDPVRVEIARANLAALDLPGTVEVGDATTATVADDEVAFFDPARRTARGRVFRLDGLTPPWDLVAQRLAGRAVAKVMPGIGHDDIPDSVRAEWVSERGKLVECCLWGAGFDHPDPGLRVATVLPSGATMSGDSRSEARADSDEAGPVGRYLFEPDDAVIRAGLVADLAQRIDGWLPDRHIAYITTDDPADTPFARGYLVLDELPYRTKQLRAALQDLDVGTLTVKKRGVQVVPEDLIAKLRLTGTRSALIVLTRVAGAGRAFLVEPLARS
ncbi:THUMP-like domain-containing protein [Williamsia sp. M5A3_1d]